MKKLLPRLMLVAVFSASAGLAFGQAVPRGGGGGGGGSSSSGSSSSGGSSGGGSSSSSGGGGGGSTASSGGGSTYSPPAHSAPPRTPSHGSSGSASSGSSSGRSAGTASTRTPGASSAPTYARPDGSNYTGRYAVPRQRLPGGGGRPPIYIYPPYYALNPWGFGFFGYGYGLNYLYDPFYYGGLGYPGYGYPGGYGYYGGGGYYDATPYDSTWDTTPNYAASAGGGEAAKELLQTGPTGEIRLKVKPREAAVRVDGVVMGTVDDFDGYFQKLELREGRHQISLQLDGFEPLTFDVAIVAGQTINYKGEMHKLADLHKR